MAFLVNEDRIALCQAAEAVREKKKKNLRFYKQKIVSYYGDAIRLLGSKKALEDCLRIEKGGRICQPSSPESRAKALHSLLALESTSEMVFMSFFHTVYRQLRTHNEPTPMPKEIMDMQKCLFGRRFIATDARSITLLAYTLGLLGQEELVSFEKKQSRLVHTGGMSSPKQVEKTTALLEQRLGGQTFSLETFTTCFRDSSGLQSAKGWKENLKDYFWEICKVHNADPRYIQSWLEQRGCAHMKSELENSVLLFSEEEKPRARIPGRNWILSFCLYMELTEEEANRLLHRCGYVSLGFQPWEEGLRYLLQHPGTNFRESLDHREDIFAFLTDCDLQPPSALFASFPYLATRPGKNDRNVFASVLLDCLAHVCLQDEGDYLAEFCREWEWENPDLMDIFFPKAGCVNLKDQLLRILCLPAREKLPGEGRMGKDYQKATKSIKNWRQGWKAAEQPFPGAKVLWKLPPGEDASRRGMQLYAILLYVVYTGHLPMSDFRFPAWPPHRSEYWPPGKPLRFTASEEAEVCQSMAESVLKSLKER